MALRGVARLLVPSKVHHPGHVIDSDARLRDVGSDDYLAHTCAIAACCIIKQGTGVSEKPLLPAGHQADKPSILWHDIIAALSSVSAERACHLGILLSQRQVAQQELVCNTLRM